MERSGGSIEGWNVSSPFDILQYRKIANSLLHHNHYVSSVVLSTCQDMSPIYISFELKDVSL